MKKYLLTLFIFFISPAFADEEDDKNQYIFLYEKFIAEVADLKPDGPDSHIFYISDEISVAASNIHQNFNQSDKDSLLKYAKLYDDIYGNDPTDTEKMAGELYKEYFRLLDAEDTQYDQNQFESYLKYLATLVNSSFNIDDNKIFREAIKLTESINAHPNYITYANLKLALFYKRIRRDSRSNRYYKRALKIHEDSDPNDIFFRQEVLSALAEINLKNKKAEVAKNFAIEALEIMEKSPSYNAKNAYDTNHILAQAYLLMDKPYEAAMQYQKYDYTFGKFTGALPIIRSNPFYPEEAIRTRTSGWVEFVYEVNEDGHPQNIIVENSSHKMFEGSARRAVEKYRYIPQIENGELVTIKDVKLKLEFLIL